MSDSDSDISGLAEEILDDISDFTDEEEEESPIETRVELPRREEEIFVQDELEPEDFEEESEGEISPEEHDRYEYQRESDEEELTAEFKTIEHTGRADTVANAFIANVIALYPSISDEAANNIRNQLANVPHIERLNARLVKQFIDTKGKKKNPSADYIRYKRYFNSL